MDERELIRRCIDGDKQAWSEFVERYSRLIYSCIFRILQQSGNSFEPTLAEELFQEIFLHLIKDNFRKLSQFKGKASFSSWLKVVVINFVLDFLRKQRLSFVSLDEDLTEDEEFNLKDILKDERSIAHDELILKIDDLNNLSECIEELDGQDKFFLEMHIYRQMSLEDLRKILKISRSAIDMRKHRLIDRLKNCFKKKGFLLEI